jgi:diguanylate cyclase (GGDEF)-like protein
MVFKRLIPICLAIACGGLHPATAATPPLSTLHAVHTLSNTEANRKLPVAFEATVLYFRSYEETLFVGDRNEAMYVQANTPLHLEPGDHILVRGTTFADYRPGVIGSSITLLHHGEMPAPVPATYDEMISGKVDCRYVVLRGFVRSATVRLSSDRPVSQLDLAIPGAYVRVTIDNSDPGRLKGLLGSEVEVTGVAGGEFDGKMQQTGILVHATSIENLRVLRPAAQDPWAIPATPIDQVIDHYQVDEQTPPVRVEGILTYYEPLQMAVLEDGSRSIQVLTHQTDVLNTGDRVEAIGIPYVDDGFLTIRMGTIRSMGKAAPIAPAQVDWGQLSSGKHAFDLVSIEGTVVVQVREESEDIYVIRNQNHLFSAVIRHPISNSWIQNHPLPSLRTVTTGSKVRVTGVAILEDGNPFNGSIAFSVYLRSADDLVIESGPSWLNVPHLVFLVGLLLVVILAVGTRGWFVERSMRRQTSCLAYVEQRRSRILEAMHATRPLEEILEEITELVSYKLDGAACWCETAGGTTAGNRPATLSPIQCVAECAVTSPSGEGLGTLFAAICSGAQCRAEAEQVLKMAAALGTLAIETSRLHADLVHRSEFDLLTDIENRFSLERRLDERIEAARRSPAIFGLIYIDLDKFKQVNDNYGHRAGDIYLQQVAQRMKRQLRSCDRLARLGGDEFAVLVEEVRDRATVEEIAARLDRCFDHPFALDGLQIHGSASIGTALYPQDAITRDGLLNAADVTMYAVKRTRQTLDEMAANAMAEAGGRNLEPEAAHAARS